MTASPDAISVTRRIPGKDIRAPFFFLVESNTTALGTDSQIVVATRLRLEIRWKMGLLLCRSTGGDLPAWVDRQA